MNNALTLLLIISVLAFGAIFAINHRYMVIQDSKRGTLLIDNWDLKRTNILHCNVNGSWERMELNKGTMEMHVEKTVEPVNESVVEDTRPVI